MQQTKESQLIFFCFILPNTVYFFRTASFYYSLFFWFFYWFSTWNCVIKKRLCTCTSRICCIFYGTFALIVWEPHGFLLFVISLSQWTSNQLYGHLVFMHLTWTRPSRVWTNMVRVSCNGWKSDFFQHGYFIFFVLVVFKCPPSFATNHQCT